MSSQCVREPSVRRNGCTYVRTACTYRRIVVRMYVLSFRRLGSLPTHWPKIICTYKIRVMDGEAVI